MYKFVRVIFIISKPLIVSEVSALFLQNSKMYSNIIYKTLDSTLEHLNKAEFTQLKAIPKLLEIYDSVSEEETGSLDGKKYPLVVLEGLDGCGKSTATKRVAKTLDAVLFCTPPPCMKDLRDDFDSPPYKEVRTAFYALGNYIAALQIATMLQSNAVVLDRFWHSTAAYALAQSIQDDPAAVELPASEDAIYQWPADLLKPDVVTYLCVNEKVRLERLKNRPQLTDQENLLEKQAKFRSDVVKVYERISLKMKYINAQLSKKKVEDQIMAHVSPLL